MRQISRLTPVAAGAIALLLAGTAWQLLSPVSLEPTELSGAEDRSAPKRAPADAAPLPPREAFAAVEQRPLFLPSRRPPPPPAPPAQAVQSNALDRYVMLGTIMAPNRATAILRGPTGDTIHLHPGQALEGWTLESIAPKKLVFGSAGQHAEIEFKNGSVQAGRNLVGTNTGITRQ